MEFSLKKNRLKAKKIDKIHFLEFDFQMKNLYNTLKYHEHVKLIPLISISFFKYIKSKF